MKCASAWSGGKDSCFACYKAMREGHDVRFLLNIAEESDGYLASHLINTEIVRMQSRASGIPLIQNKVVFQKTNRTEFEKGVEKYLAALDKKGIRGLVVGYTHEDYQRMLLKRISSKHRLTLIENLFGIDPGVTLAEMVNAGFRAVITEVNSDILDQEWLGRPVDKEFMRYLSSLRGVDLCGDYGEYHTVILDAPIFKKRIEVLEAEVKRQGNRAVLKVNKCRLVAKQR